MASVEGDNDEVVELVESNKENKNGTSQSNEDKVDISRQLEQEREKNQKLMEMQLEIEREKNRKLMELLQNSQNAKSPAPKKHKSSPAIKKISSPRTKKINIPTKSDKPVNTMLNFLIKKQAPIYEKQSFASKYVPAVNAYFSANPHAKVSEDKLPWLEESNCDSIKEIVRDLKQNSNPLNIETAESARPLFIFGNDGTGSSSQEKIKICFLCFHTDQRPAYFGSNLSKPLYSVKPRNYLYKNEKHFDYNVNSDEEWYEINDGISGQTIGSIDSADQSDEVVSADSLIVSDDQCGDDDENFDIAQYGASSCRLENELKSFSNRPVQKLRSEVFLNFKMDCLNQRLMNSLAIVPLVTSRPIKLEKEKVAVKPSKVVSRRDCSNVEEYLPEKATELLIKIVNGCKLTINVISLNFTQIYAKKFYSPYSTNQKLNVKSIHDQINLIAYWDQVYDCWKVNSYFLEKYGLKLRPIFSQNEQVMLHFKEARKRIFNAKFKISAIIPLIEFLEYNLLKLKPAAQDFQIYWAHQCCLTTGNPQSIKDNFISLAQVESFIKLITAHKDSKGMWEIVPKLVVDEMITRIISNS